MCWSQKCAGVKSVMATGTSWSSQKFVNLGSYLSLSPPPLKRATKFSLSNFWHRSKYFSQANFAGEKKYDQVCMNWLPPRTTRQVDKSLVSCLSLPKKSCAQPCKSQFKRYTPTKGLTLFTFDIFHLTFDIWNLTFDIRLSTYNIWFLHSHCFNRRWVTLVLHQL